MKLPLLHFPILELINLKTFISNGLPNNRKRINLPLCVLKLHAAIKDMKDRGIPLDDVGIQGHFFEPWASMVPPTKDGVIQTMQEYAALGVEVYITELDVNLSRVEGSHDEKWSYQAQIFKVIMDACLESSGFGVFGIDDPRCWGICFPDFGCPPEVLLEALRFDADFNPKPAFYAVIESLQEH
jgi:endo-1,4-beta-xylanase